MPDLLHVLNKCDQGSLRIIEELWGLKLEKPALTISPTDLLPGLLNKENIQEIFEYLSLEAKQALAELIQSNGRSSWSSFSRKYGQIREIGAGQRDREQIFLRTQNASELLWYRKLIDRAFFDTPEGPQELVYIPDDLLPLIPRIKIEKAAQLGHAVKLQKESVIYHSNDFILDHACTLLILLRNDVPLHKIEIIPKTWPTEENDHLLVPPFHPSPRLLIKLLASAGIIDSSNQLIPGKAREFLEMPRHEALATMVQTWLTSADFNELRLLPGLIFEGDWKNDPLTTRNKILDFIFSVPPNTWWSIPALVSSIKDLHPDYQRPSGDYDSWFIRDNEKNEYLRGFAHWEDIDGALIKYMLGGPLHWFGFIDLAVPAEEALADAYCLTSKAEALWVGEVPDASAEEKETIGVQSDGTILVPRMYPRSTRYQIARFCEWKKEAHHVYHYKITATSLENALKQGLSVRQLVSLLKKHTSAVPPALQKALHRWDKKGTEATIDQVVILKVKDKTILQKIKTSRAARFLDAQLGPQTVVLKTGSQLKVLAILAELGIFGEINFEDKEDII